MLREPSRWLRSAILVLAVVVVALCGATASVGALTVNETGCGVPPPVVTAGPNAFTVVNRSDSFVAVYLIGLDNDVFAELPSMSPGMTSPLSTTLGAGAYAVRCVFTDGVVQTSPSFAVTGHTTGAVPGFRPVPGVALMRAAGQYTSWVQRRLPELLSACQKLDTDVSRDDLAAARADWLPAHLDYERLGAAYHAFGAFDTRINGLPRGPASSSWTGFHAIEYALWHDAPASRIRPLTSELVATVRALIADFPDEEVDPVDLALRAHGILESGLQFQLTGTADYGSHTTLASVYANTEGTAEVLATLRPLIQPRDPSLLRTVDDELRQVRTDLRAAHPPGGNWTTLPTTRRRQLDGDVDALLEELSVVPNLLAPRTSG